MNMLKICRKVLTFVVDSEFQNSFLCSTWNLHVVLGVLFDREYQLSTVNRTC